MIVDLIIIAIILISTFLGYKKGLAALIIGLCSFVISILITIVLYQPLTNLIVNCTYVDETIQNEIIKNTNNLVDTDQDNKISNSLVESAKNGMLKDTSRSLAINIVSFISIVILFVGTRILLIFITKVTNIITKLPVIKQFNKAGGTICGILRGILIVYVALLAINMYAKVNPDNGLEPNIDQSYIGKTLYQNNVLNTFFE